MNDDDNVGIAAMRRKDMKPYMEVEGTQYGFFCSKCNEEVGLSPASRKILSENDNATIWCMHCAVGLEDAEFSINPESIGEIARELRKRREQGQNS